jgi:hypothetical protein
MARPIGSKNKKKLSNDVYPLYLDKQVIGTPMIRNSQRGWINWGIRNDYPQMLSELYYNSLTHSACVDFKVNTIVGDGIDDENIEGYDAESTPNQNETWNEFIRKIIFDYVLYGEYAFQIIKNRDGKTFSFYHQPISSVRVSPQNEEGDIVSCWICEDWTNPSKYKPIEVKRFNFQEEEKIKIGETYLFYYETYQPDLNYYSTPDYAAGVKAIQSEIEYLRYDLRASVNNFSAAGFLTLPQVETDEERRKLIQGIRNTFTGSDNANNLIISFANSADLEANVPKFTKIDAAVNNVSLFKDANDRTVDRIVSAHRIPSKGLIGKPMEGASLGGDGNQLNVAYNLFLQTYVKQARNRILGTINNCFKMNGLDIKITLKNLEFNLVDK